MSLARLRGLAGIASSGDGLLVVDAGNHRIRYITPRQRIVTVAGTGVAGAGGDGEAATRAQLRDPTAAVRAANGDVLVSDSGNQRIRVIGSDGTIRTLAGDGTSAIAPDGAVAAHAPLAGPRGIAPLAGGGFLLAESGSHRIRHVNAAGEIRTVAGTGAPAYTGDGGAATAAALTAPSAVALTADGGYLIADAGNRRIRRVDRAGVISTIVPPVFTSIGLRGTATTATLRHPDMVATNPSGGFVFSDRDSGFVYLGQGGQVATVAGYAGLQPSGVVLDADRTVLVASRSRSDLTLFTNRRSARLALRIDDVDARRRRVAISYSTTRAARVSLVLSRRGRNLARTRRSARAGHNTISIVDRARPGLTYRLTLSARSRDGKRAAQSLRTLTLEAR